MAGTLTKIDDRFVWQGGFETKDIPKGAGFRWDKDRRHWWTRFPDTAAKLVRYADATCKAELDVRAAKHAADMESSRAVDANIDVPVPDGLAYLPFQRAGIAYASSRPATLIGDEMGLGKTVQAIGVINADPSIARVLVVCPASLKLNWKREMQRWLVRPMRAKIVDRYIPNAEVVIINYDVLHAFQSALRQIDWDLLVVDECHYCKNPKARRTKQVVGEWDRTAKTWKITPLKARRRLFLTGTPIVNRPVELWPIVNSVCPERFPAFWPYAMRFCNGHQGSYGWDFSGASHLDELQDILRSTCMVRRLKKDVLTELPPKRRQVIEMDNDAASQAAVDDEMAAWSEREAAVADAQAAVELAKAEGEDEYAAAVKRLRDTMQVAFTEISRLRHQTALAKVDRMIEHLEDAIESSGKVVFFAHHHDVIDAVAARFGGAAVVLTGKTEMSARQAAVDRFQTDASCTLFVGSITAAGVGLTLTAASHVVFGELDWVPGNVTQAEDRCHRIGQAESVLVQHLVLADSLDCRMAHTIVAKQAVIDQALDKVTNTDALAEPVLPLGKDGDQPATVTTRRDRIAALAEKISLDQIGMVHNALRRLAGMCDGASSKDGHGFNKMDSRIGHELAERNTLSAKQAALGLLLALKYRRQLGNGLEAVLRQAEYARETH